MKIYKKAILPLGFRANGVAAGIKRAGNLDLALFYSNIPAKAACQFTTNKLEAAPIKLNKKYLKSNKEYQAIIVNSGNANSFTGSVGLKDAEETTKALAKYLGMNKEGILVASTGIIGRSLPLVKLKKAIPQLIRGLSRKGIHKAKKAIMTTDTFSKEITAQFNIGDRIITICGVAKGAGMIAPNMACTEHSRSACAEHSRSSTSLTTILSKRSAPKDRSATMLVFILTDALITQGVLNKALRIAVDNSFNCITVDGCMSTNDTIISLANGASSRLEHKYLDLFIKALNIVCLELAKLIIKDAEGATKFIKIKVDKAKSFLEARRIALSIANSSLFKTAMYGQNPNFGRIIASIGASGVELKERDLKIKVSPLYKKNINVDISINRGKSCATVYTSDLTPEYIKINAEYN